MLFLFWQRRKHTRFRLPFFQDVSDMISDVFSTGTTAGRLRELADAEGIDAEDAALAYVARMADGSMRDALSLLDQCNAFYIGQKLKYENVLDVLGAVDSSVFGSLLKSICSQDVSGVIHLIDEIVMQGRDLTQFVVDFTWYLRNLLMVQSSGDLTDLVEASAEQLEVMRQEASGIDASVLMRYIRIFRIFQGRCVILPRNVSLWRWH